MKSRKIVDTIISHFRNYLVTAALFAAGIAVIQNRNAIVQQFTENDNLTILGIPPIWVTIAAGISLALVGALLAIGNMAIGAFELLEFAGIPETKTATLPQRIAGLTILLLYVPAIFSVGQILLVLSIVTSP